MSKDQTKPGRKLQNPEARPRWVPCKCGEFWCRLCLAHAFECGCEVIENLAFDPYKDWGPRG